LKILIYTTHRTGSTSLAELLMSHYDCDYHRGSLLFPPPKNIIIKITPTEFKYEEIKDYFDKIIVLVRENINEQAESWLFADKVKKYFVPYTIDNNFLEENKDELGVKIETIKNENEKLKTCDDALHITYEELYYSTKGISEIENYLNTKFAFKIDSKKKYRDTKKPLL